jgi:hypothetical protein
MNRSLKLTRIMFSSTLKKTYSASEPAQAKYKGVDLGKIKQAFADPDHPPKDAKEQVRTAAAETLDAVKSKTAEVCGDAAEEVKEKAKAAASSAKEGVAGAWGGAMNTAGTYAEGANSKAQQYKDLVKDDVEYFKAKAAEFEGEAVFVQGEEGTKMFGGMGKSIDAAGSFGDLAKDAAHKVEGKAVDAAKSAKHLADETVEAARKAAAQVKQDYDEAWRLSEPVIKDPKKETFVEYIAKDASSAFSRAKETVDKAKEAIKEVQADGEWAAGEKAEDIANATETLDNMTKKGASEAWGEVTSAAKHMKEGIEDKAYNLTDMIVGGEQHVAEEDKREAEEMAARNAKEEARGKMERQEMIELPGSQPMVDPTQSRKE